MLAHTSRIGVVAGFWRVYHGMRLASTKTPRCSLARETSSFTFAPFANAQPKMTSTAAASPSTQAMEKGKGKMREVDSLTESSLTYNETIESIVQFLEAAFHTVLYMRGVYPAEIFKLHRLYSLPVYRSRHPGLNEYITGLLSAIRTELAESKLKAITLIISSSQDGDGLPLEKYVFEVDFILSHIRKTDRDLSIRDNLSFREIGLFFKAFLMKLSILDAALEELPPECKEQLTFAVVLEMRNGQRPGPQGADPNQPMEGPWVPADSQARDDLDTERTSPSEGHITAQRKPEHPVNDGDGIILPVKSLDSGVINLMLFVEDNPARKASLRTRSGAGGGGATQRRTTTAMHSSQRHQTAEEQVDHLHLDADRRGTRRGDIEDIEDALSRDAQGSKARHHRGLHKRIQRPTTTGMGDDNAADADDDAHSEDDDDAFSSSSGDGGSSSDGTRSDASIQSVGDFAGYGGAGAGGGGAGMTSGL